eukprot:10014747-Karenia_brevis.AAC.1
MDSRPHCSNASCWSSGNCHRVSQREDTPVWSSCIDAVVDECMAYGTAISREEFSMSFVPLLHP